MAVSSFIESLKMEIRETEGRLRLLKQTLNAYEGSGTMPIEYSSQSNEVIKKDVNQSKGTILSQLKNMFVTDFHSAVRMPDIQTKYEQASNKKNKIENLIRELRKKGDLVAVRYDGKNIATYWGKSEWVNGGDFKSEYKPSSISIDAKPEVLK